MFCVVLIIFVGYFAKPIQALQGQEDESNVILDDDVCVEDEHGEDFAEKVTTILKLHKNLDKLAMDMIKNLPSWQIGGSIEFT